MMYVELMKKFLLADSNELMVVRLISASWAKKRWFLVSRHDVRPVDEKFFFSPIRACWWLLDSFRPRQPKSVWFLLSRHDVLRGWWKIFISPIRSSFSLFDSFRPPEPKNVWFLLSGHDVRRVHENFLLADSSELMAVRLILASWNQKRLIATFQTWCTSTSWKIFFSLIRASGWLLDSFRPPEPKNVWFLLSRHDVRRVHEKFLSRRFDRADGCSTHSGLLSPRTFDSFFLDMMYVEFMKNFLLADSSELMTVRLISSSSAQKRLIPTF